MTETVTLPRTVAAAIANILIDSETDSGDQLERECWAIDQLKAALDANQSPYGDCDECGTPYSYDPTDNGCVCVRCLKERLRLRQPEGGE